MDIPQHIPPEIVSAQDYEALGLKRLPADLAAWLAGGSAEEWTLRRNREAFGEVGLRNSICRVPSGVDTRLPLLGQTLPHPLLLAPVANHGLVHPEGEIATAQGAEAVLAALVLSSQANTPLEQVAGHVSRRWMQLYWQQTPERTLRLIRRAEDAGYSALVLTLDAPVQALSRGAQRQGFALPAHLGHPNLEPAVRREAAPGQSPIDVLLQEAATLESLDFILGNTSLPVLVKGVMESDDAVELLGHGVHGLIVSNHGGRALDGVSASLEALPRIRQAVGDGATLLFDGGIRSGHDVFKALALGADAVLIGRLQLYALAVAGPLGVAHMLKILHEELQLCMALTGCATCEEIGPHTLRLERA
ncbi:MAG: alpha-hydroxy-acid oxidizing protein [Pseudomonadales bacterium]|nr:alpha-hydroxy-acid oxidizing protein [Pseudomonadales bacterium]